MPGRARIELGIDRVEFSLITFKGTVRAAPSFSYMICFDQTVLCEIFAIQYVPNGSRHERKGPQWASRALPDFQWGREENGPRGWQLVKICKALQPIAPSPV